MRAFWFALASVFLAVGSATAFADEPPIACENTAFEEVFIGEAAEVDARRAELQSACLMYPGTFYALQKDMWDGDDTDETYGPWIFEYYYVCCFTIPSVSEEIPVPPDGGWPLPPYVPVTGPEYPANDWSYYY